MFVKRFDTTYYFPPRPMLSSVDLLERYEKKPNWIAEIKMNGTNCEIKKLENGKIEFWDRHKKFLQYNKQVVPEVIKEIESLNFPAGTVINAELLHSKTKYTKHILFFHTILILDHELFNGVEYSKSRKILEEHFKGKKFKHLWLAKQFKNDFTNLFKKIISEPYEGDKDLVEGIVLKDLNAKLRVSRHGSEKFGLKVRKPHKNYAL